MLMLSGISIIISFILVIFLGLFVVFRNYEDKERRYFFFTCLSLSFWQLALFLSDRLTVGALFANRIVFAGPLLAVTSLWFFVGQTSGKRQKAKGKIFKAINKFIVGSSLFISFLSLSPFLVLAIKPRFSISGNLLGYDLVRSPFYVLYLIEMGILVISLTIRLIYLQKKLTGIAKTKISLVLLGFFVAALFGTATNLILPILLNTSKYSFLGSLSVLAFVTVLAFAIIKHKIIDVQAIVARIFGYIFSVIAIYIIFGIVALTLFEHVTAQKFSTTGKIIVPFLIILATYAYRPIFDRFNKLTNKIFYRDAYDAQTLLDDLNQVLVSTIDLQELLKKSAIVIEANLKSSSCVFGIGESGNQPIRIIGTVEAAFDKTDIATTRNITALLDTKILITEDLPPIASHLRATLVRNNISVLVRLISNLNTDNTALGYLILGAKKSGHSYTPQDIKIIDVVTNELVIAIQNALRFEEIQEFAATLQERVDEATRRLQRTNDKLKALDETKDEFISMASHQLRTPLTSVKGYLSMVLEGDAGQLKPMQKQLLDQAFVSSQRMVFLIADLLNVSRLRTGKFVIDVEPTELPVVIEQEIKQLSETAQGRNLTISYKLPHKFPTVMLDETKIRQVVMNFLDNAIYYTPSGGHISVVLSQTAEAVEFKVIDNGIGVPKQEQHHLFTKFYRAGNAKKARPDGTGLGLFMAQKVVVAQGGSILFNSHEGKGSTFGFSFAKNKVIPK
ncbi:MAG: hypothetical protein NVSMB46_04260 [Candidatus Saccharimonadales bacterium]